MSSPQAPSGHAGSLRRLAAILSADIVSYSRMMGLDEEGTHSRVKQLRRDIIDPTVAEHRGRIFKNMGDGFLAMFDSPLEAARCAMVIQQAMAMRNTPLPQDQWIQYRIGVNLGDVIVDGDDVFGDGVNIAARLQSVSEPGNVYISGGIYEQIKNKLVCGYQSLGDEKLKNITDPVRIYRVLPDPAAITRAKRVKRIGWVGPLAVAAAVLIIPGIGGWYVWRTGYLEQVKQAPISAPVPLPPPRTEPPPQRQAAAPLPVAPPTPEATHAPDQPVAAPSSPPQAIKPQPTPAQSAPGLAVASPPARPPAPHESFRDCSDCPEMIVVPAGEFEMGSGDLPFTEPRHRVTIANAFAIGRREVSFNEWDLCVTGGGCKRHADDQGWGRGDRPAIDVTWDDARAYAAWLSQKTGGKYRLPSEAEWEYAARAGTTSNYWWGGDIGSGRANCAGCGVPVKGRTMPVGSFAANAFGLFDTAGNAAEWVEDCWNDSYRDAPRDGSAWRRGQCNLRVLRGGSFADDAAKVRSPWRWRYDHDVAYYAYGFRVVRDLR